jgi:hypothetical protein
MHCYKRVFSWRKAPWRTSEISWDCAFNFRVTFFLSIVRCITLVTFYSMNHWTIAMKRNMRVGSCGFVWICVDLCGFVWICVDLCGFVWICVDSCGFVWMWMRVCSKFMASKLTSEKWSLLLLHFTRFFSIFEKNTSSTLQYGKINFDKISLTIF